MFLFRKEQGLCPAPKSMCKVHIDDKKGCVVRIFVQLFVGLRHLYMSRNSSDVVFGLDK